MKHAALTTIATGLLALALAQLGPSTASACPDGDKKPKSALDCPDGDKKPKSALDCPDGDKKPKSAY